MKKVINTYKNIPGEHCGSAAMRNLLAFYTGLDLPEGVVFGLGAGIDFFMLSPPGSIPMMTGRSVSLELDAAAHLGIHYEENIELDNDKAWTKVREEIISGKPVMLTGDIYHLDYREFKVHFPAHRFVLVGFDDEKEEAHIMDRIKETHETCSYQALTKSRNPLEGISTFNLWGKFNDHQETIDLEDASRKALYTCASRMLGIEKNHSVLMQGLSMQFQLKTGIEALNSLPEEMQVWREGLEARKVAGFNADCIEKFGTGGGMFRNLYVDFLSYVNECNPGYVSKSDIELMERSSALWTSLANKLYSISEDIDNRQHWEDATDLSSQIGEVEEKVFSSILDKTKE